MYSDNIWSGEEYQFYIIQQLVYFKSKDSFVAKLESKRKVYLDYCARVERGFWEVMQTRIIWLYQSMLQNWFETESHFIKILCQKMPLALKYKHNLPQRIILNQTTFLLSKNKSRKCDAGRVYCFVTFSRCLTPCTVG